MAVIVQSATDLGLKRSHNEDSHRCWVPDDPAEYERRGVLLLVADGMGGSKAGEVASRVAVETAMGAYRDDASDDPLDDLRRAVESANRVVHEQSTRDVELGGMGTTLTAAVIRGDQVLLAHVGDSRAYLVRNDRIVQLTRDHSLVAQMVRDRQLTPEQARVDPRRNVVTRSVGVEPEVEVDIGRVETALEHGDTLLLCTDGLHGLVSDEELCAAASDGDLNGACEDLVALARQRGGHDNITVLLARYEPADRPEVPRSYMERAARTRSSQATMAWLMLALLVLLLALGAIALVAVRLGKESKPAGAVERRGASLEHTA